VTDSDADRARQKVEQLITKALSTDSADEARSCAMSAVQIIRKYGLRIAAPGGAGREQPSPSPRGPTPSGQRPERHQARWIQAGHWGFCIECLLPFEAGDRVWWQQGEGCMCQRCRLSF
jgi:hypothetical protein